MTREELRDVLAAKLGQEGAAFAMALFDHYEREQKANGVAINVSEPDARELLAWGKRIVALQEMAVQASKEPFGPALADHVLPSNEMYRRFIAAIERELPPGPEEGEMTSHEQARLRTVAAVAAEAAESLRVENERLRQLGTEIRNRLKNHARTLDLDDWALASIRACDAWDAALDQERK